MSNKQKEEIYEDEDLLLDDALEDSDEELEYEDEELEEDEDVKDNGTQAASTLRPDSTKSEKMQTVMNAMNGMSGGDMMKFFELVMGQIGQEAGSIDPSAAAQNKASIDAKGSPVAEDLEVVFGDNEDLSEDVKDKMTTIFEAALNSRLEIEKARLEEEYEEQLNSSIEEATENIIEKVDAYMDYVAEQWLEENEVAVDTSLKTALTENFIQDLGELCQKYNLDLPEGQDDVIENLVTKVDELEEQLDNSMNEIIESYEVIKELRKSALIEEATEEVPPLKYQKFKQLAENIEYEDDDDFLKKLDHIKEGFFSKSETKTPSNGSQLISEEIAEEADEDERIKFTDPAVRAYHEVISRTASKR